MKVQSNTPQSPKKPNEPQDNSKLLAIVLSVLALASVGGFLFYNLHQKNDTQPKTEQKVKKSSVKPKHSSKAESSKKIEKQESSEQSSSSSESKPEESKADPVPNINALFTAYYQYKVPDISPKQQADEMVKYASEDVVNKLIPGGLSDEAKTQYSFNIEYKLTSPIVIQKVENSDDKYNVSCDYEVTVEDNKSEHSDSYVVTTDGDKIVNVSQQSAITK